MDVTAMLNQATLALWNLNFNHWRTQEILSTQWWCEVALLIITYTVWWKLTDKRRLPFILLFGSFVAVSRVVMDIIGSNMVLWSYNIRLIPLLPNPFIHDFTITPLTFMLVYQYCSSWRSFIVGGIINSACITFILLPLLNFFHILTLHHWSYFYSFILIFLIAILSRAIMLGIFQIQQKSEYNHSSNLSTLPVYEPAMKPLDKENGNEGQ